MYRKIESLLQGAMVFLLALHLASCGQKKTVEQYEEGGLGIEKAMEGLKAQRELRRGLEKMGLDSSNTGTATKPSFPRVVGHVVLADMRSGRKSTLVLNLEPATSDGPVNDKIECDPIQMNLMLSILQNPNVLYDAATKTFMYSSATYNFNNTIVLK